MSTQDEKTKFEIELMNKLTKIEKRLDTMEEKIKNVNDFIQEYNREHPPFLVHFNVKEKLDRQH